MSTMHGLLKDVSTPLEIFVKYDEYTNLERRLLESDARVKELENEKNAILTRLEKSKARVKMQKQLLYRLV